MEMWYNLTKSFKNFFLNLIKLPNMERHVPLVVILGATGTGKTKLSLELSKKFNGEVIGADAMQVYEDLDILTAKATKEERSLLTHHLIDVVHPSEQFTVLDYRNKVLPIINKLFLEKKLPVVVGGTNYYIESILWKILMDDENYKSLPHKSSHYHELNKLSDSELYTELLQLDPERAEQLHPNDRRKLIRSLEIYRQKGCKHSKLLETQRTSKGGSSLGGGLRYPDVVIFWLKSDQAILDERLNARVDTMIKEGLIEELEQFCQKYMKDKCCSVDYTKGIFQSIGLREFDKYLMKNDEDDSSKLLNEAVSGLKMVTRRYARKQKRWIENRLLSTSDREVPPVYGLDVTDLSKWNENVKDIAFDVVESYVNGNVSLHQPLPRLKKESISPVSKAKTFRCEVCDRIFVGDFQWNDHLKSHRHKRVLSKKKRRSLKS